MFGGVILSISNSFTKSKSLIKFIIATTTIKQQYNLSNSVLNIDAIIVQNKTEIIIKIKEIVTVVLLAKSIPP
jgi:hypothetical protein